MTSWRSGTGTGMCNSIPEVQEREGNGKKPIPKIQEREGNGKKQSQNSGMGRE